MQVLFSLNRCNYFVLDFSLLGCGQSIIFEELLIVFIENLFHSVHEMIDSRFLDFSKEFFVQYSIDIKLYVFFDGQLFLDFFLELILTVLQLAAQVHVLSV